MILVTGASSGIGHSVALACSRMGASVICLASLAANSHSVGYTVYSTSKSVLISYSRCLPVELAPREIGVNCIGSSMVRTDLILQSGVDVETLKEDEKRYSLKRYGIPADIANLATYFALGRIFVDYGV